MPKKICKTCKQSLPATKEYFHHHSGYKDKLHPSCKECVKINRKKNNSKEIWYQRAYGMSVDDFTEIRTKQGGKCKICGMCIGKLYIDHDHITGVVRGLLCNNCNTALGKFNDDIELMKKAIRYLENGKE